MLLSSSIDWRATARSRPPAPPLDVCRRPSKSAKIPSGMVRNQKLLSFGNVRTGRCECGVAAAADAFLPVRALRCARGRGRGVASGARIALLLYQPPPAVRGGGSEAVSLHLASDDTAGETTWICQCHPPRAADRKSLAYFCRFFTSEKKTLFQMRRTPRTRWEKGKGASSTSVAVALYCTRWEYFSALESGTYQKPHACTICLALTWVLSERRLSFYSGSCGVHST